MNNKQLNRPLVVASIMLAIFMVAIEATIVATAMPKIVGDLGGFERYSWVFAAFLLAQTTTTVIYGKLTDLFGRRPVIIVGIMIFLVGSLLCGLATSMTALVIFRLLQGTGAGAIQPVAMTIVGDLYPIEKRGRIQGLIASVWAFSAVTGPLAGGLIVEQLSWSWIFWINIPIGLLTIAGFWLFLHETVERRTHQIDYAGAALFSAAMVALIVALTEAGTDQRALLVSTALFVVFFGLFLRQEWRAAEPIVDPNLWTRPLLAIGNTATLLASMGLIGLTTILPLYVQGVLGRSALLAGFVLTALAVGWPLAAILSARLFKRFGLRATLRLGGLILPVGASGLLFLSAHSHPAFAGASSFVMGFGMGLLSVTCIVLIQDSVGWNMRGAATASNVFARSLGNTLGASVLGAILNIGIMRYGAEDAGRVWATLETPAGLARASQDPLLGRVLDSALHLSFWGIFALAVLALIASFAVPISPGTGQTAGRGEGSPEETSV